MSKSAKIKTKYSKQATQRQRMLERRIHSTKTSIANIESAGLGLETLFTYRKDYCWANNNASLKRGQMQISCHAPMTAKRHMV